MKKSLVLAGGGGAKGAAAMMKAGQPVNMSAIGAGRTR